MTLNKEDDLKCQALNHRNHVQFSNKHLKWLIFLKKLKT